MKTCELIGPALDWAVAKALRLTPILRHDYMREKAAKHNYTGDLEWHLSVQPNEPIYVVDGVTHPILRASKDPRIAQPIISTEQMAVWWCEATYCYKAADKRWMNTPVESAEFEALPAPYDGPTPLVAAMRCFVASRLGDEIEIPEELLP